jgi:hypothetical protein
MVPFPCLSSSYEFEPCPAEAVFPHLGTVTHFMRYALSNIFAAAIQEGTKVPRSCTRFPYRARSGMRIALSPPSRTRHGAQKRNGES